MATAAAQQPPPLERRLSLSHRERKPSTSAPLSDFQGPVGPDFTRPKFKRTATGFGATEIKAVEASIPEAQREAWIKFVRSDLMHHQMQSLIEVFYRPQNHSKLQKSSRKMRSDRSRQHSPDPCTIATPRRCTAARRWPSVTD